MLRINSLKNFIAYNKILDDYKKLEFYYKEYQEKKEYSEGKILMILVKEINELLENIISNKTILNIDYIEDLAIQNDINNHLLSINEDQNSLKSNLKNNQISV